MAIDTNTLMALAELCVFALLVNMPLGAWRVSVRKLSWQWFVSVHLCVPIIFILRHQAGLSIKFIPVLILFSLAGHFLGGKLGIRVIRRVKDGILAITK